MVFIEEKVYEIMREFDVSYVLVIFGGFIGYFFDGNVFDFVFSYREYFFRWGEVFKYL